MLEVLVLFPTSVILLFIETASFLALYHESSNLNSEFNILHIKQYKHVYSFSQPQEVGITSHHCNFELSHQMVNDMVSREMFVSIIREVVEEIGVAAATLVSSNYFLLFVF